MLRCLDVILRINANNIMFSGKSGPSTKRLKQACLSSFATIAEKSGKGKTIKVIR